MLNKPIRLFMKFNLHKADTRGHANHGWLNTYHTFSFGGYLNPDRNGFGVLRVLNDDTVQGGNGFGKHPHQNMEIISIPLKGDLEHQDSMGTQSVIKSGDVQVMSAGTGVFHSEKNKNATEPVEFLQIWVIPNKNNVEPRYDQITIHPSKLKNQFHQIVSPNPIDEGVWIHQNAWFHLGHLDKNVHLNYHLKDKTNGLYIFVLEGSIEVENQVLERRDGLGLTEQSSVRFTTSTGAQVLLMEVPMKSQ